MIKLLLVEDDPNLSYIIQGGLEDVIGGYEVITASNGKEGLQMWKEHAPDIIISDIEMPVMDGYQMVERIRQTDTDTPILLASARVSPKDVTAGYRIGANNYIKKPFIPEELDAHIQGVLKLKNNISSRNESNLLKIGEYTLDADHASLRHTSGTVVTLTSREAEVLRTLCQNKGQTVRREAILEKYWNTEGNDYFASRSLDVFISKLRKKLADDPRVEIRVIKGVGICLNDQG
ncbi:MAG: response regulator transcription factor [Bacteroides sp.]|nr:response regulator transcription factor [Bacteroides sp.]